MIRKDSPLVVASAFLSNPAVEAHLAGLAHDLAEAKPVRFLWLLYLPGLTPKIFNEAAFATGIASRTRLDDGRVIENWPKLGGVSGAAWLRLKTECCRLCGTTPEALEWRVGESMQASSYVRRWREGLRRYQQMHGIDGGVS